MDLTFLKKLTEHKRQVATAIAVAGAVLLSLVLGSFAFAAATLPDPTRLDVANQSITIIDRNGALIEQRNPEGARVTPVKLDQVSPFLKNATIAAEDRRFYEHHGIDWGRVVKAFFVDVVARRPEQGASTITQQLAKISVLRTPQKTPLRKLRELILATQLEARYSKDQILELYLNSIYYGHHATGVEAASEVYFGKPAKALTLAEASMLAGLPSGPSFYDPKLHSQRAKERQRYVLDGMVRQRMITQEQAREAEGQPLSFSVNERRTRQAPHFVDFVIEELETRYGPNAVSRGGLVVKTTLDLRLQGAAQRAVEMGVRALASSGADNGDLVALDPRTGEILAMVGSVDFFNDAINGQFNIVTGKRQPGSSFKPYVYAEAFRQRRLNLATVLDDRARAYRNGQFHDFDYRDLGQITVHQALLLSRNIPALRAMEMAGIENVIALAHEFGIKDELKSEVGTAIGSSEIRMLDNTVGYGVFAADGVRHPAISILELKDRTGHAWELAEPDQKPKPVLTPAEAFLITYVLKDYSAQWNLGWNRPMAGKSGTTDHFRDAWMMAYGPNIVIGAWVGHTGPGNPDMKGVYGSDVGRIVLREFINNGLSPANIPPGNFRRPPGLIDGSACADQSGSLAPVAELFLPGTERTCPTPTPRPSPSASPTLTPTETPSPTSSPSPTPKPRATPTPQPSD